MRHHYKSYLLWTQARQKFFANKITRAQAAGMVANDLDFVAEAELKGFDPIDAAREVVDKV